MITLIAGARPNFMKIAPLYKEFKKRGVDVKFCYTGQHKDYLMSQVFIEELGLPEPDYYGYEFGDADLVIVVGDVDSSYQAAITAKSKGIKVAHVEAGLRSNDLSMPEEVNRIAIDKLSDYWFVTEPSGKGNLIGEGITENVHLVGNVMIDNLANNFHRYILLTLHRPSNVDNERLGAILQVIDSIGIKVFYPVHPRVSFSDTYKNIVHYMPLSYNDFLNQMLNASLIVTDSGGVQEEAAYLGRRCITLRANTERPITQHYGNVVIYELAEAKEHIQRLLNIPLWDGKAAERIVDILI